MKALFILLFSFFVAQALWARETAESLKAQGFEDARLGKEIYRRYDGDPLVLSGPEFGFLNRPNATVRDEVRNLDHVIFNVQYHIDQYGRRDTGDKTRGAHFLALFGCSFTFGTGLEDSQTLSADLSRNLRTRVYNYGIPGGALNQALYRIKTENMRKQIPEVNGIFIYLPIESHVARVAGIYPALSWMKDTPHFVKKDGQMEYDGTIKSAHPYLTRFYEKAGGWLGGLFEGRQFPRYFQSHFDYFCDLTEDFSQEIAKQFPGSRFVVVNHPVSPLPAGAVECLQKKNITVISLPLSQEALPTMQDHHPTGIANEHIAQALKPILEPILQSLH